MAQSSGRAVGPSLAVLPPPHNERPSQPGWVRAYLSPMLGHAIVLKA